MRGRRDEDRLERAHARARERGVSRLLYGAVRTFLAVVLRLWFRVTITGAQNIPAHGPAIIAPNHKSFLDAFFVGVATRRHVRYMAKSEIFRGPLAGLLVRLGAFPVRRGEADAAAVQTARAVLAQGGVVVVFPEGTRVDEPDALGSPHHGAGRLALEAGAPIVPTAIAGTSHLWLGPIPKPRHVRLTFLGAVDPSSLPATRETLRVLIDGEVWPAVQQEYGRLAVAPGPIVGVLAALGITGGLVARSRHRRSQSTPRLLGVVPPRRLRRARRRWPRLHWPGRRR